MNVHATIYDDNDQPIEITGNFTPPHRGTRNEYGVPMEPDDPEEMEVTHSTDANGNPVDLTPEQHQHAVEALWDALAEP